MLIHTVWHAERIYLWFCFSVEKTCSYDDKIYKVRAKSPVFIERFLSLLEHNLILD